MKTFKATIVGVTPLLMHSERLADPTNELTKELKKLTAKRQKTDGDLAEIKKAEWRGGLYLDDEDRPAVPVDWLLAAIKEGARKSKLGKQAQAGVYDPSVPFFRLTFDGPEGLEDLYECGRFCDYRGVGVNGKRVMRARPCFPGWSLSFHLDYDPETIDGGQIEDALHKAGQLLGIGDYRPRFGRFVVSEVSRG